MQDTGKKRTGNFVFVGGTQGIGKAAALAVAASGSAILLIARNERAGKAAAEQMLEAGASEATFIKADLATVEGASRAAQAINAWKPEIHGLTHSAMTGFSKRTETEDGLEMAFALQYLARAIINRLCADRLAASGDGRIVHIAGAVTYKMGKPAFDDLQFKWHKWGLFKALLASQVEGLLFFDEAGRRWADKPISLYAASVGTTKTQTMKSPEMPLIMRIIGLFGTTPERSAANAIRLLLDAQPPEMKAAIFRKPKSFQAFDLDVPTEEAAKLWDITTAIAAEKGLTLP